MNPDAGPSAGAVADEVGRRIDADLGHLLRELHDGCCELVRLHRLNAAAAAVDRSDDDLTCLPGILDAV